MPCTVTFNDFQQEHLVVGDCELLQGEDRPLALVSPHDCRVVAHAQDVERRLLLRRAFCELAVGDDKLPGIDFEGDVRLVRDHRVDIDHVVVDINTQYLDSDAVLLRADAFHVHPVLAVDIAEHPFHGRGLLAAHFL